MKKPVGLCLLLIGGFLPTPPVSPQTDFFSAAGIIDLWPRLYPQYTGKDNPSNHVLIVQNVAGAVSMIAASSPNPPLAESFPPPTRRNLSAARSK
jgi:hypothetical protein